MTDEQEEKKEVNGTKDPEEMERMLRPGGGLAVFLAAGGGGEEGCWSPTGDEVSAGARICRRGEPCVLHLLCLSFCLKLRAEDKATKTREASHPAVAREALAGSRPPPRQEETRPPCSSPCPAGAALQPRGGQQG